MGQYNFYSKALDGTITPEIMDYIVDKHIGYDDVIINDGSTQLTNLTLTGVNQSNSDDRVLYIKLTKPAADTLFQVYSDSGRTALVASHTIVGGTSGTSLVITQENASGITGTVDITYIVNDTDIELQWADGSEDAPYQTLLKATTVASTGDNIGLVSGYYNESRAAKQIIFYGSGICSLSINYIYISDIIHNIHLNISGSLGNHATLYLYNCSLTGSITSTSKNFYLYLFNSVIFDFDFIFGNWTYILQSSNCTFHNVSLSASSLSDYPNFVCNNSILSNCTNLNTLTFSGDYNNMEGSIKINGTLRNLAWVQANTSHNQNSMDDNPLFNNTAISDFSLQNGSPCIFGGEQVGDKIYNIGAKHKAHSVTALSLFNNADQAINCELNGSNNIISSQHNVNVAGIPITNTEVLLDSSASAVDDYYNGLKITIVSGTGSGNTATITDYVGSSKTATIDTAITTGVDSYYSIGILIESDDLNIGNNYISGALNLLADYSSSNKYDSDHTNGGISDVYIKWSDTQGGLSGASYELMYWNNKLTFDSSNSAGNADDSYSTGDEFNIVWFKVKFEAYVTA